MTPVKYFLFSAGLLVSVMADYISFTEWPTSLTAGQPVTLKWIGGSGAPATITLRKGISTDLQDVQVLSSDAMNGEFSWTPPADLQNANDYAFQITQGDEINYTGLLPLSGGSDTPNANALNRTQSDADNMSSSAAAATDPAASMTDVTDSAATAAASATETTGTGTTTAGSSSSKTNTESAATAVTDTASSTGSAASDASATAAGTTASEGSSATSSGPVSTETAKASKMNTPFQGSQRPTSTDTASSNILTGSAGRVGVPLAFVAGAAGFLLLLV